MKRTLQFLIQQFAFDADQFVRGIAEALLNGASGRFIEQ
jgi:hypothetical protein